MKYFRNIMLVILLTLLFFSLNSCQIKEVEVGDIKSFNIINIDKEYVTIDIAINVKNPNNFSFTLSKVDLDLTFNSVHLGKIDEVEKVTIPKNSDTVQHLVFKLKMEHILKGSLLFIPSLLTNKAKIKVKGYIKTSKFPFSKKIEVDYHKTTPISKKN